MIEDRYGDKLSLIVAILKKEADFDDNTAFEVALRVMNYFGYSDEIIDNMLDSDDRKLFYFLQDLGILGTRWEEMQLISGKNWRIFYWLLKEPRMRKTISRREGVWRSTDIYRSLPDYVWTKGRGLFH
ncbi:MAG: hypothetical protein HPY73_00150 [Methanomassiliicoccales archaeon]|nr:MAG: hypothetical protein HPY73_00150 [Methanomassiliicoccales archaeon]